MKLLERIALNRLIQTIANFIIAVLKIFKPQDNVVPPIIAPDKKKKPLRDLLNRWRK